MERVSFARHLRKNQTEAEAILWQKLRARRFCNLKFRRQVPIDKYTVDFVCEHQKLITELDGFQHDENQKYDNERRDKLQNYGYRVLRVWNENVYLDVHEVLDEIKRMIGRG